MSAEKTPETPTAEPAPVKKQSAATVWKYRLIKAIDVSGLTFLTPVIRLITWEEPRKQLIAITQMIVVPILAVLLFVGLWAYIAPKHKTKSGEVPGPAVVWDAAQSIWRFHVREQNKETAYNMTGDKRELYHKAVQQRLEQIKPLEEKVNAQVKAAEAKAAEQVAAKVAPVQERYEKKKAELKEAQTQRVSELREQGKSLDRGDEAGTKSYLAAVRKHEELTEKEQEELKAISAEITDIRSEKQPVVKAALKSQTRVAEERQYLVKMEQLLSVANRGTKVDAGKERLQEKMQSAARALGTDEAYEEVEKLVQDQARVKQLADSDYAGPWTLPLQVYRSVACVFVGFLLGSAIAIPIGVLCGLSRTIMSALTPFIALFKPVSPIVWLPIALIIVGGFIEDPDKHWLITLLAELPLIGWMKINPAFMACAITVALCSLWATLVNTALGVASIEKDHLNVAAVLRLGFKDRLFKIIIPSSLPLIFAGLRISLGVGWMVLIAAELLSSSEGIGKFVWDQFSNGAEDSFAKMFVVVFYVGFVGFVLDRIMIVLQRSVTFDGAPTAI